MNKVDQICFLFFLFVLVCFVMKNVANVKVGLEDDLARRNR